MSNRPKPDSHHVRTRHRGTSIRAGVHGSMRCATHPATSTSSRVHSHLETRRARTPSYRRWSNRTRPRPSTDDGHRSTSRRSTRLGSKRNVNLPLLSPDELREDLYANETLWRSSTRGVVLCNGAEHVDDVEYWLSYMPMRNRAEVIRLMLAYADVPYAFEVVGYLRYEPEVKSTMNFGKTPALIDIDGQGTDLTHETAVTRYLADELNLGGSDSLTRARVDELFSQYWHTVRNNGLTHAGELYSAKALKDATEDDVVNCGRFHDTHRVNTLSVAKRSLQALRVFEEILETNKTPYLVGADLTYVDLALLDTLWDLGEEDSVPDFADRFNLPRCGEFLQRVAGIPAIDAYLRSPSRIPRYERPEYAYIPGRLSPAP